MEPAVTTGGLRQRRHPDLALAQQLAAAARVTETAPLLSHLRRAAVAARLALRVSSAASWLHATRLLGLSVGVAAGEAVAGVSPAATTVGSSGLPGLVQPIPKHPAVEVGATTMTMVGRLKARAGLIPTVTGAAAVQRKKNPKRSNTDRGKRDGSVDNVDGIRSDVTVGGADGPGGGGDAPAAVLAEMTLLLRDVFEAADEEGFGEQERLLGSGPGKAMDEGLGSAVCLLLERGLAVVAYRYLDIFHLCWGLLWRAAGV